MPHAFEFPWMRRSVIPLMRRERLAGFGRGVIDEFVAFPFGHAFWRRGRFARFCARLLPRLAAVAGTLDDLPKPTAALRNINPIRINRRAFQVINFPAGEMWPADVP